MIPLPLCTVIYMCSSWILPQRWTLKFAYYMGEWFGLHNLKWWSIQNLSNDLNNLLTLLQTKNLSSIPDIRHWKLKQSSLFIINSLYRSLNCYHEESNCFWWIWTIQALSKTKVHMWISFHDRLLTTDNLAERGRHITTPCILCGVNPETSGHIFLHCSFTLNLWAPKRARLSLFSWASSIASLWGWLETWQNPTKWS